VPVDSRASKYQLWVANWNVSRPTLPQPWSDFSIWQAGISTMSGRGSPNAVDQNIFNGSLSEFKQKMKV
jgi:GH25 family lysozyme M1 (1,4-beta-N-acetylmuramidase)